MVHGSPPFLRTMPGLFAALAFGFAAGAGSLRAEAHAGIELGGKGVKAVVLEIAGKPGDREVHVVYSDTANVGLAAALDKEGRLDPKAVAEAAAAVAKFMKVIAEKHAIKPERIAVVGSSGLFSGIVGRADRIAENREALAGAVKAETGAAMAFIDAAREASLLIAAVVPETHRGDGLLIDIGGGNTKGGYRVDNGADATFAVPYGVLTFHAAVAKAGGDFPAAAAELRESLLAPAIRRAVAADPGFAGKKRVYLSGGIVWATATFVHPADRTAHAALTPADFDAMETLLRKNATAAAPDLAGIADADVRRGVAQEIAKINAVYTRDQLLAGVQILKALAAELDLGGAGKRLAFARHAPLGWIVGYVVEKAGASK